MFLYGWGSMDIDRTNGLPKNHLHYPHFHATLKSLMTDRERKLKRKIQTIVATSMASFFTLVLVMVVLLMVNGSMRSMENNLIASRDRMEAQIRALQADTLRYLDPDLLREFIDEFAMMVLGYGRGGSSIIVLQ